MQNPSAEELNMDFIDFSCQMSTVVSAHKYQFIVTVSADVQ